MYTHRPKKNKMIIFGAAMAGVAGLLGVATAANAATDNVGTWVVTMTDATGNKAAQSIVLSFTNSQEESSSGCFAKNGKNTITANVTGVLGTTAKASVFAESCANLQGTARNPLASKGFIAPSGAGEKTSVTIG